MPFVDLHLHLLPGVDDGPVSVQESLVHARAMVADGVLEAVVTPHFGHPCYRLAGEEVRTRTEALQRRLDSAGVELRLRPGAELHPAGVDRLPADELDLVAHGPRAARWVLLEAPFEGIGLPFLRSCDRLRALGFGVLVAHPERAAGVLGPGLERLRWLRESGALLQVNACSLAGRQGAEARAAARRLVRDGSAFVIASDGHGPAHRSHTLRAGYEHAIAAGVPPARAAQLTSAKPRALLERGIAGAVAVAVAEAA